MSSWKRKLRNIFRAEKDDSEDQTVKEAHTKFAELNMRDFFKHVVFPAYDNLKEEIEKYGRTVMIDVDETGLLSATLTVYAPSDKDPDEMVEEFYFEIRGRAYQKGKFAFPAHADEEQPPVTKVEMLLRSGSIHEYDIKDLSQDDIVETFVNEYSKWINY